MKISTFLLLGAVFIIFAQPSFAQTDIESILKKSGELEMENKLDEAIDELGKAIQIQPDNHILYFRRAQLYFANNNKEAVAEDANRAIALNPNDKQTILSASRLFRNIQRCEQALILLNDFVSKNAASDEAFYARAHSKMCLDDWTGAYEDVSTASELNPKNNNYRTTQAGILARLGDSEKSFEKFDSLVKKLETKFSKAKNAGEKEGLKRDLANVYRSRANAFHLKGDETSEFADLAKFIEYNPQEFSYRQRAKIYQDHKMYAEAINDFTEAIRLSDDDVIFLLERGDVFVCAEKYTEALQDYEQALKLDKQINDVIKERINSVKARIIGKR